NHRLAEEGLRPVPAAVEMRVRRAAVVRIVDLPARNDPGPFDEDHVAGRGDDGGAIVIDRCSLPQRHVVAVDQHESSARGTRGPLGSGGPLRSGWPLRTGGTGQPPHALLTLWTGRSLRSGGPRRSCRPGRALKTRRPLWPLDAVADHEVAGRRIETHAARRTCGPRRLQV